MTRVSRLTLERLLAVLDYDPEVGKFFWKPRIVRAEYLRTDNAFNTRLSGKEAGSHDRHDGYRYIKLDDVLYRTSRLAWLYMTGEWPEHQIDHVNVNPSDDRWCNLRGATGSKNIANRGPGKANKSGFKGVNFCKATQRWQAQICVNYKKIYLGCYDTKEKAHAIYMKFAYAAFGEFYRAV